MNKKIEEEIKGRISDIMGNFLFEKNNTESRKFITDHIDEFLDKQNIYSYKMVCNVTNNTDEIVNENKLVVDVYVRYVRKEDFKHYHVEMCNGGIDPKKFLEEV